MGLEDVKVEWGVAEDALYVLFVVVLELAETCAENRCFGGGEEMGGCEPDFASFVEGRVLCLESWKDFGVENCSDYESCDQDEGCEGDFV